VSVSGRIALPAPLTLVGSRVVLLEAARIVTEVSARRSEVVAPVAVLARAIALAT
jgi:hypothetical protein